MFLFKILIAFWSSTSAGELDNWYCMLIDSIWLGNLDYTTDDLLLLDRILSSSTCCFRSISVPPKPLDDLLRPFRVMDSLPIEVLLVSSTCSVIVVIFGDFELNVWFLLTSGPNETDDCCKWLDLSLSDKFNVRFSIKDSRSTLVLIECFWDKL
jgi:hypothetical protein